MFFRVKPAGPRRYLQIVENHPVRKTVRILKASAADVPSEYALATPKGYAEKAVTGNEAITKGLLAVGSAAPDWSLGDSRGPLHSLKEYRGKVVLLDFWGTWCQPCKKSMPAIQGLHERFAGRGVAVFGVAVADKEGNPAEYMKGQGYSYTLLLNGDEAAAAYKATVLPTLYVLGIDGTILHAEQGFREQAREELTALLEKYLRSVKK